MTTPDDPTTDDDQPIPQSDQSCDGCGRPLPDPKALRRWRVHHKRERQHVTANTGVNLAPVCPCGVRTPVLSFEYQYGDADSVQYPDPGQVHRGKRDPYPPHDAPWLADCDCDECAESDHLTEACQRATDYYSDTEDDMTDDPDTIDDPEAYLEERYGCEVTAQRKADVFSIHYSVDIPGLEIVICDDSGASQKGWGWALHYGGECIDNTTSDLPNIESAARAADDTARDLLAETAERLEGCDGGDHCDVDECEGWRWTATDFSDVADRAEQYVAEMQADPDLLGYLARHYSDAYPVPPADRFEAIEVAYEVPCGLGAVRFAESDGHLYWRRVAVDEQTGYRGDGWSAVEGLAPVCRDAESEVCALRGEADRE